jgi:uncharacterized protein (DUF2267 family)
MIMAAFRFGFLSHVIRRPDSYWNPNALRAILTSFATELKPSGYDVLKNALADLATEASTLFKSHEALVLLDSFGVSWSWDSPPADRRLHPLANRLLQWLDDGARFGDAARNAVHETSTYGSWFNCGRWLGDCVKQSQGDHGLAENGFLQSSIHYLQESVGKLPSDFLEIFHWLKTFCDFDFRTGSPADWFRKVPLADGIAVGETDAIPDESANTLGPYGADLGPDVTDFASFFDYFYERFNRNLGLVHFLLVSGFEMVPGITPLPGAAGGPEGGADAVDQIPTPIAGKRRQRTNIPAAQLESEIRAYIARRQTAYDNFRKARTENQLKSKQGAQAMFGRNALAKAVSEALGKKISSSRISATEQWKKIKQELSLDDAPSGFRRRDKIGLEIAIEEAAEEVGDTTTKAVLDHELIARIEAELPEGPASDLISRYQLGTIGEEGITEILAANADHQANPPDVGERRARPGCRKHRA